MTNHKLCIAPMMEWTDRHYRYLVRLMTQHTRLYTEMVTSGALIHGDRDRFLEFNACEHPIALQLGGSEPKDMAQSAKWGESVGYDEVNINVGCPSDRVQAGRFGVCLMREPRQVATCISAMREQVDIPITVKCRIGVDDDDSYEFLCEFVDSIIAVGCETLIVHARKAWLKGLNPKQNREIPELDYQRVYMLKNDYPALNVIINGGIDSIQQVKNHLQYVDGAMIGRQAYKHPEFLLKVDSEIYNQSSTQYADMNEVILKYAEYVEDNIKNGTPLKSMTKHILNVYQGIPGAKLWRRYLSENMHKPGAGVDLIHQGLELVG
ncbi:MAG: tRNA dihydrouridine(20/20a) synthase DusA [Gammaproteobacteria bacterium]|nr:tRNA dihydrouridine(20/20a) synthase DusA [Gammaproteobacteria bacterium]